MAIHPQFRSSATPGAAPDVADMLKHEVAINTADAKLFAKDVNDVLQEYSITGETITRFVISQADATANPAQVGERIRIVATSETISLPFPQDPVQGQTITIITHQDSDAGFFAELSSTGIPFRVEDTESTAPHVLRFSADDNGTETSVDGEYMLTFTGAFWTLDNPMSLSLVPNALHWRSGNADFYAGELAAGRSVTVLADDGHFYKLSTDRTVYLGEVPDGVVRNNLTPEHIDSVVWTVSVNRNDRWNGTAWAPHPGAQGSPDPIPGIPSVDPSALANTARGEYADWIRLDSRVEYVRGATYENLLVKSDDSVSSKIIDDLSTGRRKVGDIISIESFFRASDYADGLPHGFNKAVIVDGQHGTLSDTLFAVGDYRLKLLFDDDIYRATQLGAKDDLTDYSSFLRNLTENVAAGKTLVFDDFTYHITALKIFSNTTVKTSNGGSFRCIDGTGVDSGSNYYLLYNLGESGVVYDSIVVDGNKANNSAFNLFDAITCVGDKSKVINCKVTNAADSGIFIGDGANMYAGNNEIEGATDAGIYANRNTVHTGEYSVTIENNQIHDCTEAGIAVKRVAQKVNVNTNTVTGTCDVGISLTKAGDVSAFGILGKSSINGNTVDTAGGLCVAVHNSMHVSVANNVLSLTGTTSDPAIVDIGGSKAVSVSGNTIAGDKQTNGATQIKGILIRDRERNAGDTDPANNDISEGVTISSNPISDCDVAHNILIMPGGNVSKNIKYRGNVIIDCNAEFLASPGVDTVNLSDATSAVVAPDMAALKTATTDNAVFLQEYWRAGLYVPTVGNFAAKVAADPRGGVYVPFPDDPTGSVKCRVRSDAFAGRALVEWWTESVYSYNDDRKEVFVIGADINAAITAGFHFLGCAESIILIDDESIASNESGITPLDIDFTGAIDCRVKHESMFTGNYYGGKIKLNYVQLLAPAVGTTSSVFGTVRSFVKGAHLEINTITKQSLKDDGYLIRSRDADPLDLYASTILIHQAISGATETVPTTGSSWIDIDQTSDEIRDNVFEFGSAWGMSAEPFIKIICATEADNIQNTIIFREAEQCLGGLVYFDGMRDPTIKAISYDTPGGLNEHAIHLLDCLNPTIDYHRRTGGMPDQIYDIYLEGDCAGFDIKANGYGTTLSGETKIHLNDNNGIVHNTNAMSVTQPGDNVRNIHAGERLKKYWTAKWDRGVAFYSDYRSIGIASVVLSDTNLYTVTLAYPMPVGAVITADTIDADETNRYATPTRIDDSTIEIRTFATAGDGAATSRVHLMVTDS